MVVLLWDYFHIIKIPHNEKPIMMRTKKKILVVDDDLDIQNALATLLEKRDFEVITASNKKEGLEKARSEHPDLAILDVMMEAKYDGFELAKTISEERQLNYLPVVMLTSIEILTTSRSDMHAMVQEFRKSPNFSGLDVLLVKNQLSGDAAIDYQNEQGESIYFNVAGFLAKPVDSSLILPEVDRILAN